MTTRISTVDPAVAESPVQAMYGAIKGKFGMVPNTLKTLAHAPGVLEGYLAFNGALGKGVLPASIREQIYLAVSQANGCEYCVSAHTLTGKLAGLKPEQILEARQGKAQDPKAQAVLNLVHNVLERRGNVSEEQFADARAAGLTDAELLEVLGNITAITLTNYINNLAHTDIDFPRVSLSL